MDLSRWLSTQKLVVCVGSGGVGKTTTAATIGLHGAVLGRKVIVLTIDPAKRLANSLGLDAMGGEPTRIDLSKLPEASGELWAMMLDSQSTFDALISSVAPSAEVRDRILSNHVYRHMADAFAGSQDYMATEKLYDLVSSGDWDLVVLDTPPVKNALDFFESPGRVVDFLDEKVLSWFLTQDGAPKSWGARLLGGASNLVYKLLGAIFGDEFLGDLREFLDDFNGLYDGFRERHQAVLDVFRAEGTAFVTVCAPTESSVDVAVYFQEELSRRELPRSGVVINQVHRCEATTDDAEAVLGELARRLSTDLPEHTAPTLLARLGRAHRRLRELVDAEQALGRQVRAAAKGEGFFQEVPRLEGEVHDLAALREVGRCLFEEPAERA